MPQPPPYEAPIDARPWDRQTGEGDQAFQAFRIFRELDPHKRTVVAVKQWFDNEGHERSMKTYYDWSAEHAWSARVRAWDVHLDLESQRAAEKERREMGERHARLAMAGLAKAAQRLMGNDAAGVQAVSMNDVSFGELSRAIETFAKLERSSRGTPEPAHALAGELEQPPVPQLESGREEAIDRERAAGIIDVLTEAGVIVLADVDDVVDGEIVDEG